MRNDELNLSVQTTGKLIMVLAWCIQKKEYREKVLPEISTGEPLVNAFIDALEGKPERFKSMIGYRGGKAMQEGITEEVIQVLQARAERRDLSRKWFATWEK